VPEAGCVTEGIAYNSTVRSDDNGM